MHVWTDFLLRYAQLEKPIQLNPYFESVNKMNSQGDQLEYLIKDLLCDTLGDNSESKEDKDTAHSTVLSWTGSHNEPPDMMIDGGESIEVKKFTGKEPTIALNSSIPKQVMHSDNPRLHSGALGDWEEKDMVYVLGSDVSKGEVGFVWIVYGDCWCASNELYEEIDDKISESVSSASADFEYGKFSETNEIGRLNDVDKNARASLRIRGMWQLEHPAKGFKQYIDDYDSKIEAGTPLFMVVRASTFNKWEQKEHLHKSDNITVHKTEIDDPDDGSRVKVIILESL